MTRTTTETSPGSTAVQAKEHAQQQAEQARGQAKDKLREQIDQRSTQAGERVGSTAQDVRTVAEELRKQGKDAPARYVEQAADRAERVGGYLEQSDGERILRDVEDFGRRNPWAVAAGGLLLGFAASRMLKASSSERYRSDFANGSRAQTRSLDMPAGGSFESAGDTGIGDGHGTRPAPFEPHR